VWQWRGENDIWLNVPFSELNKEEIEGMIRQTYQIFEDLEGLLTFEDTNIPKEVLHNITEEVNCFCEESLPVIIGLRSEKIRQRHWDELRDHLYQAHGKDDVPP